MDLDELFPTKKPKGVTLGDDISRLSVEQRIQIRIRVDR